MPFDRKETIIAPVLQEVKISVVFSKSHTCETIIELAYFAWNAIIVLRINFVKLFSSLLYPDKVTVG
jgi:hypothetical protein